MRINPSYKSTYLPSNYKVRYLSQTQYNYLLLKLSNNKLYKNVLIKNDILMTSNLI